ncbi:hypothetical protein, unlikely [Trypanosoma congolense IL3000]|uniref:Uncharacterized protein n=1 Tax=Trypanosoma congolense (strain IL3000) TaxID=1068625 RepID=F9WI09_TRYCI|nr:hypothetical protein, unlikely [Trypanosoma congolense IL3000]
MRKYKKITAYTNGTWSCYFNFMSRQSGSIVNELLNILTKRKSRKRLQHAPRPRRRGLDRMSSLKHRRFQTAVRGKEHVYIRKTAQVNTMKLQVRKHSCRRLSLFFYKKKTERERTNR